MNIIQIFKKFPEQKDCIEFVEKIRWDNKPVCPYCQSTNTNNLKQQLRHHCNGCRKSFSVTVGTLLHNSKLPMQKWFLAISLMMNAKKGISSRQLARDLELPVKTAWSVAMRIRGAMKDEGALLQGIVEMDETYVGGKPRKKGKKDNDDKGAPRGRGTKKTPVVGMVERGGNVKAESVLKRSLKSKDLNSLIRKNINPDNSVLVTDEYLGYSKVHEIMKHYTINHQFEYANGDIHTNTIESFWAIVKRGIIGQFHKVSDKYLDLYLAEFCFRYNRRKSDAVNNFEDVLLGMVR